MSISLSREIGNSECGDQVKYRCISICGAYNWGVCDVGGREIASVGTVQINEHTDGKTGKIFKMAAATSRRKPNSQGSAVRKASTRRSRAQSC